MRVETGEGSEEGRGEQCREGGIQGRAMGIVPREGSIGRAVPRVGSMGKAVPRGRWCGKSGARGGL